MCCNFVHQRLCFVLDCVYIGTIHTQHFALCEMMIKAGKNVLCEKPMCINNTQCEQILALAKKHDVFCLEVLVY